MTEYSYFNPVKIISGLKSIEKINQLLPPGKTLIITDPFFTGNGMAENLSEKIKQHNPVIFDKVSPNPELDDIDSALASFRGVGFENVIAMGGGSVMDFAKAAAVFLKDDKGRTLDSCLRKNADVVPEDKLFLLTVPTTSGTGSEVTPFATVWDSVKQKKYSLAGDMVFPSIALLDPMLTSGLPADFTLYTGLDVISHSLESIWNKNSTPVSEAYALQSLRIAVDSLPAVFANGADIESRMQMQWASTLAGFAISQTRTAIAHSISYPLTLRYKVPHGLACGFTLEALIDIYIDRNNPGRRIAEIFNDIKFLLVRFDLKQRVAGFASPHQVKSLTGGMYNPARADNYLYQADEGFISDILDKSL